MGNRTVFSFVILALCTWSFAEDSLAPDLRDAIDKAVPQILKQTGALAHPWRS